MASLETGSRMMKRGLGRAEVAVSGAASSPAAGCVDSTSKMLSPAGERRACLETMWCCGHHLPMATVRGARSIVYVERRQ
jgi:hypothetical protein